MTFTFTFARSRAIGATASLSSSLRVRSFQFKPISCPSQSLLLVRSTDVSSMHGSNAMRHFSFTPLSPKTLSAFANLPKLAQEPSEAIADIWRQYHDSSNTAHGVTITREASEVMQTNAKRCPLFILPVFKDISSFVNMLVQMQDQYIIMTYLEEYKVNPSAASSWLSVATYNDLAKEKGLTLVRADFLPQLTKREAIVLTQMLVDAFTGQKPELLQFLETFNHQPQSFDFEKYMLFAQENYRSLFLSNPEHPNSSNSIP